ncbi:hypothetical protein TYRP_020336 [Tyrophagus putrescentiae]|nr:hypothetical protein TYRP_020336 [Tyrophagus putrescentiae]
MYDVSRNLKSQRMESTPRGGSTFTPPKKIPPPQPPPPPPSNSVKKELADFEQNRCQDISSEKCAPALQILIIFYRFFGFSFSGVLFINKPPPPPPPKDRPKFGSSSISSVELWSSSASSADLKKSKSKTLEEPSKIESPPSSKSFFTPLRIVLLLYNLIIVTGYLFPVITDHLPIQTAKRLILGIHGANVPDDDDANNNSTLNNLRPLNFGEYFARTTDEESISVDRDSFSQLKPVMRTIIRSLVAVFFLEGAGSFLHSLLFGGRLLRRLAAISTQDLEARALQGKGPCSRRHAVLVIVILFCSIPLVMSAGFAAFDQQISEKSFSISSFFTASRLRKIAIHWWHFIALSTYSTLFVVSMLMVGRRLQEMTTKVEASKRKKSFRSFGEPELAALYQRVEALQGHFRTTVACFSLPVTFTLAASTFTLIGSVCFLMISPDRSYASFIFSIGLFALLRLFVVNSCGNLATAAYGRLLRTVYEAMGGEGGDQEGEGEGDEGDEDDKEGGDDNWSVDAWLLFGELRRLKADFKVAFFAGTFTVKQSSILTLVGFSIQYIVILLQTENYDGGGGSAAGSSVSGNSSSSNMTDGNWQFVITSFSATSETIEDPPASLQLLVRFYRFFSLSFTGVLFTTTTKSSSSNSNSSTSKHLPLRLFLISANLAAFTFYILPLLSFLLFGDPWAVHASLKNNSEYTLGKEIFDPTFATLKPVLKTLITSMAWLMMAESTFTCGHNLLAGGGLVRQLADLSSKGVRSLTKVALAILAFISLGLTTFARAYLVAIFESLKAGKKVQEYHNENPYLLLGGLALKLLKHTYHYFTYSLYPLLFAYLMTTVKQKRLQQIKARLQTLQGHLQEVINSLALPLTLSMVVTTLLLTGTVCFLIVNSGGDGGNQNAQHFGLFFCNVAAFHLLRLVALCAAGSQAEAAHEDLLLTLYGRINSNSKKRSFGGGWDVDAWLAFQELKRLDFRVTLFGGLYRLRQSTILAVLAFVSNHIVVLLQTENYGRGGEATT